MKRILIVDDDPDVLASLTALLEDEYVVETAADGVQALQCLESGVAFDAIVLDLMMPRMTGMELMVHVRSHAHVARDVPVIIQSAQRDAGELSQHLGAADFLIKPFPIAALKAKLRRVLPSSSALASVPASTLASSSALASAGDAAGNESEGSPSEE